MSSLSYHDSGAPYVFLSIFVDWSNKVVLVVFLEAREAILLDPRGYKIPSEGVTGQQS